MPENPTTDISVLTNMHGLRELAVDDTLVADLSPLKGLPLVKFSGRRGAPINDLSPLAGAPLEEFHFSPEPEPKGLELFRAIKTLRQINDQPAAEFWAAFDKRRH